MRFTRVSVSYKVEIIEAENEVELLTKGGAVIATVLESLDSASHFEESGERIGGFFGTSGAPFEVHWSDNFKPKTNESKRD